MTADLEQAWTSLGRDLDADADTWRTHLPALRGRYEQRHRAFHTLDHIGAVLAGVDRLVAAGEPHDDLPAIRAAAWFHDAIYEPGAPDNEAASAHLAEEILSAAGVPADHRGRVVRIILSTATHTPLTDDERILVDADLAILAAAPEDYRNYVVAVRQEYRRVDDARWRAGRGAFLRSMLAREQIFSTPTMLHDAEATARRNLQAELADLDAG